MKPSSRRPRWGIGLAMGLAMGLGIGLALACAPAGAGGAGTLLPLPAGRVLELVPGGTPRAVLRGAGRPLTLKIDAALQPLLVKADALIPVVDQGAALESGPGTVVIARLSSNPARRTGYCGAGEEDLLLLLAVQDGRVLLRDQLRVRSCLNSIYLHDASGREGAYTFPVALGYPWVLDAWRGAAADERYCVRVARDRLHVDARCGQPGGAPDPP